MHDQVRRNSECPFPGGNAKLKEEEDGTDSGLVLDEDDAFSNADYPKPPDGGWGWVVVFASFMIHVIADGVTYSFGIFVVKLMDVFEEGRGLVSLIPSILVGVTLCSGPISSSLTNRYGCRAVTIAGAALAAVGLALSAVAPSIVMLYITVGLMTGIGFGFIYLPAIVSVTMYFEKKRAFATGIAVCGSGVGTFILSPVTGSLIEVADWTGAFLVTAAIVLLSILFGALFKPLTYDEKPVKGHVTEVDQEFSNNGASISKLPEIEEIQENADDMTNMSGLGMSDEVLRPLALQLSPDADTVARMALSQPALSSKPDKPNSFFGSFSGIYDHSKAALASARAQQNGGQKQQPQKGSGIMFRKDILYGGSLYNIPEYKENPLRYSQQILKAQEAAEREASIDESTKKPTICGCIPASAEAAKTYKQMMDFSLLKDFIFLLYAISNFLTSIGFNVPYVYTVDRAKHLGVNMEDASYLLSVIGIANTMGRIILGYISDKPWINRLYIYIASITICGLTMMMSNFCETYTAQAIYCAVFGVTSGAYIGLTSVVLVDLLGLDRLTNAFGLLMVFQGLASAIGPPIIGALYDWMGNYDSGFYFAGAMMFISGVMLMPVPSIRRREQKTPPALIVTAA